MAVSWDVVFRCRGCACRGGRDPIRTGKLDVLLALGTPSQLRSARNAGFGDLISQRSVLLVSAKHVWRWQISTDRCLMHLVDT